MGAQGINRSAISLCCKLESVGEDTGRGRGSAPPSATLLLCGGTKPVASSCVSFLTRKGGGQWQAGMEAMTHLPPKPSPHPLASTRPCAPLQAFRAPDAGVLPGASLSANHASRGGGTPASLSEASPPCKELSPGRKVGVEMGGRCCARSAEHVCSRPGQRALGEVLQRKWSSLLTW